MNPPFRLPIRSWEQATEAIRSHGERISTVEGKLVVIVVLLGTLTASHAALIGLILATR